jgi:nucleoid DNA-binding protein
MNEPYFDLSELVAHVTSVHYMTEEEARCILTTAFEKIATVVANDGFLHLENFGSFSAEKRIGRTYDAFGIPVTKGERIGIEFVPAKAVREVVKEATGLDVVS